MSKCRPWARFRAFDPVAQLVEQRTFNSIRHMLRGSLVRKHRPGGPLWYRVVSCAGETSGETSWRNRSTRISREKMAVGSNGLSTPSVCRFLVRRSPLLLWRARRGPLSAEGARSIRGEIETQAIGRERRRLVGARRVDRRVEMSRLGPRRAGDGHKIEQQSRCVGGERRGPIASRGQERREPPSP